MTRVPVAGAGHPPAALRPNLLKARRLGIDMQQEAVVFMRWDCHVCRAEGFTSHARIQLSCGERSIIATLYHVTSSELLRIDEAGLSEAAWQRLALNVDDEIAASHPRPLDSLSLVRGKVYGHRLEDKALQTIISDVTAGRYSDIHLSSFITACSARSLDREETISLTRAMVDVGDRLTWDASPVVDKHCVGGLPGNRTTPIVVAIAVACGLVMPKTSSRAITSPAGTADTMETMAPVDLDLRTMRAVVEREGGCITWGGAVRLSPADDILIRVERALDLDSEGQLVASVLSKKIAAGSSHVVLDLPVGPTAKVRSAETARSLTQDLIDVAQAFGLKAQGGMRRPPRSSYQHPVIADRAGRVGGVDNRRVARVAKLAGAPDAKAAGIEVHVRLNDMIEPGQPLYTIHAEAPGELAYALDYVAANPNIYQVIEP